MKLITVSGLLGSGKTTLIRRIVEDLSAQGKKSAIIVNETGEETYDASIKATDNILVEYLRGG